MWGPVGGLPSPRTPGKGSIIMFFFVFWGQGGPGGWVWASLSSLSWVTRLPVVPCGAALRTPRDMGPIYCPIVTYKHKSNNPKHKSNNPKHKSNNPKHKSNNPKHKSNNLKHKTSILYIRLESYTYSKNLGTCSKILEYSKINIILL